MDTINEIEGEIASQRVYSSILLNKLKDKYSVEHKKLQSAPHPNSNNGENTDSGGGESKQGGSSGKVKDPQKLFAIQRELQQIAHPGEVQSGEADKQKNHEDMKDPNYKDGEDFHQGEVLEMGGGGGLLGLGKADKTPPESVIAVLVFVCNRPTVKRNLDQLFKYRPSSERYPIIVSQDCGSHPATTSVIRSYGNKITHIKVQYI